MFRFGLLMTVAAYWYQSVKQTPRFFRKSLFLSQSQTPTRLFLYSANSTKFQQEREMAARTKTKRVQPSSLVNCHLQVIGTGGGEVPPCLFLFTDTRRYLFNCGENVQRLCHEHKVKVSKLENVFVTRVTWDNLGGLPGLAMTLRDIGITELSIHGPFSLEGFISASQVFMGGKLLKLTTPTERVNDASFPVYSDENLTITTVDIPFEKQLSDSDQSNSDSEASDTQEPHPKKAKSIFTKCFSTTAFICKLVDTPGKFNVQKATELGLPPGPDYKILKSGGSVTTKDGKVILPSDVVGPTQKGPTFVILECPRIQYVSSVTTHPMLQKDAFSSTGQSLILIAHIVPPEVLENEQYCKWMASFGPDTKHLVLHGRLCPSEVGLRAIMKVQCPLHLMNPSVHHAPPTVETEANTSAHMKVFEVLPKDSIIFGRTFTKYHVKPITKIGVDNSCVLRPLEDEIAERVATIQSDPRLTHAILHPDKPLTASGDAPKEETQYSDTWEQGSSLLIPSPTQSPILPASHLSPDDALVTFLGTGASIPSKYRNVSGILVQTPYSGCVLLDCGEGTLTQIYRCFGKKEGDDIVCNLRTIFTSHIHGDHHLGLINVLQRRAKLLRAMRSPSAVSKSPMEKKTVVIGPVYVGKWLKEYTRKCESVPYKFVNSSTLTSDSLERYECRLLTVPVVHCKEAYGVVLEHSQGWKIVYSGDTRPCSQLVQAGKNATLLLHEATLEDDLLAEARARKHSTISEALDIAEQMNPDFTILTHFSQRYPKVSQSLLAKGSLKSKVAIAFDCMSVRLKQLHELPLFLPTTKEIFADFEQDDTPVSVPWTD